MGGAAAALLISGVDSTELLAALYAGGGGIAGFETLGLRAFVTAADPVGASTGL